MALELLDTAYYRANNSDLTTFNDDQLRQHFQQFGLDEGREFSPFVNLRFYGASNPDLATAGVDTQRELAEHLQTFGIQEGRDFSPFVDLDFYGSNYSDLAAAGLDTPTELFDHLRSFGVAEGRRFSRLYSPEVYLAENPDLQQVFGSDYRRAFEHLNIFGLDERRRFAPAFDLNFYANSNPDLAAAGIDTGEELLQHFVQFGSNEGRRGANVLIGGGAVGDFADTLTGVGASDRFRLLSAGATVSNFETGTDIVEIVSNDQPLTFFDLVSNFYGRVGGTNLLQDTSNGVSISTPTPDGSTQLSTPFATLQGATSIALANSPESFAFRSQGNAAIDANELVFDASRIAGFPPAASTRNFALVSTAVQDAVQGILADPTRSTFLQSQGLALPTLAAGVARDEITASIAAAAATTQILTGIFTDPDSPVVFSFPTTQPATPTGQLAANTIASSQPINTYFPRIFNAALNSTVAELGASTAVQDAAVAFGNAVADALLNLRRNDGAFRNLDGTRVNPGSPAGAPGTLANEYRDGIEPPDALNEIGGQDLQGDPPDDGSGQPIGRDPLNPANGLLNEYTVGRLQDGTSLIGTGAPIVGVSSSGTPSPTPVSDGVTPTTPGAWRRGEDTLLANGQFAGLASIEVASINDAWVLPTTNYFNDNVLPPPALDTDRYIDNVEEVRAEGSILDLPASGNVVLNGANISGLTNATNTVNGVTSFTPGGLVGAAVNDTDTADQAYGPGNQGNDFGFAGPDGLGLTSADRTIIGHVWANAEGTYGPNYAWQKVVQQLAINNNSSLAESAYVIGAMNVALADGFINIWDTKWDEDYFWRPVTSIRNADQLAGTAFLDDNAWTPREITPQHPCHPSGTSLTAGVASTVLSNFFGDEQTFTVSADPQPTSNRLRNALVSLNGNDMINGVPLERVSRTYNSLAEASDESRTSRIYAGAHFRFATENGVNLGEQVATYFLRHNPFLATTTTNTMV